MKNHLLNAAAAGVAAWLALAAPAGAQGVAPGASPANSPGAAAAGATGAIPMPHGIVPSRSELPMSAFNKLDSENKGYVTRQDVQQLDGFGNAFAQADQNHDGRLNASEFNSAWASYTGNKP